MNPYIHPYTIAEIMGDEEAVGTTLRATRFRPSDRAGFAVSPLRASIGRIRRSPEAIAILVCLAIWGGTFLAIWRL